MTNDVDQLCAMAVSAALNVSPEAGMTPADRIACIKYDERFYRKLAAGFRKCGDHVQADNFDRMAEKLARKLPVNAQEQFLLAAQ